MIVTLRFIVGGHAELVELPTARAADVEGLALIGLLLAGDLGATSVEVGAWQALPTPPAPSSAERQALAEVADLAGWPEVAKSLRERGTSSRPAMRAVVDRELAGDVPPRRRAALERLREVL